jgi:hypothetical protein
MPAGAALYRALTCLYPKAFRLHYGDDLVMHFADLVERDGAAAAWRRTTLDLLITVPRYRLESVMNTRRTTTTLLAIVAALTTAAVGAFAAGFAPLGLIALLLAAALAIAERSRLARSMRPAGRDHRRRTLWSAVVLGACSVASLVIGLVDLGDRSSWPSGRLLAYNVAFFATAIGALACVATGLRRPPSPIRNDSPA